MIDHIKITPREHLKVFQTLFILAREQHRSVLRIRREIREAIQDGWNRCWQPGNLMVQWKWQEYFPADRCPTVSEFIVTLAREMEAGRTPPYLLG